MANGRLLLRCAECRETVVIGRFYPSTGWYASDHPQRQATDTISAWLNEHGAHQQLSAFGSRMDGGPPFTSELE